MSDSVVRTIARVLEGLCKGDTIPELVGQVFSIDPCRDVDTNGRKCMLWKCILLIDEDKKAEVIAWNECAEELEDANLKVGSNVYFGILEAVPYGNKRFQKGFFPFQFKYGSASTIDILGDGPEINIQSEEKWVDTKFDAIGTLPNSPIRVTDAYIRAIPNLKNYTSRPKCFLTGPNGGWLEVGLPLGTAWPQSLLRFDPVTVKGFWDGLMISIEKIEHLEAREGVKMDPVVCMSSPIVARKRPVPVQVAPTSIGIENLSVQDDEPEPAVKKNGRRGNRH